MSTKEQYWKYSLITIIIGLGIILARQITPFLRRSVGCIDHLYTGQAPDDLSVRKAKDKTEHSCHRHYGRSHFMLSRSSVIGSMAGGSKPAEHQP